MIVRVEYNHLQDLGFTFTGAKKHGWGTWIRTTVGGVRVHSPAARRSPIKEYDSLELNVGKSMLSLFQYEIIPNF